MRLLFAGSDVDPGYSLEFDQTPRSATACYGHRLVMELLLARDGVETNHNEEVDRTGLPHEAGTRRW